MMRPADSSSDLRGPFLSENNSDAPSVPHYSPLGLDDSPVIVLIKTTDNTDDMEDGTSQTSSTTTETRNQQILLEVLKFVHVWTRRGQCTVLPPVLVLATLLAPGPAFTNFVWLVAILANLIVLWVAVVVLPIGDYPDVRMIDLAPTAALFGAYFAVANSGWHDYYDITVWIMMAYMFGSLIWMQLTMCAKRFCLIKQQEQADLEARHQGEEAREARLERQIAKLGRPEPSQTNPGRRGECLFPAILGFLFLWSVIFLFFVDMNCFVRLLQVHCTPGKGRLLEYLYVGGSMNMD
ncbi:expressed unknown protein [Seminavis robusta]|uniref:Uncharacterized protein n=1 Tax=Seminavis robusta TaxID=568900 RepID=A0A9N8HCC9_9STRA|nr:expressed unknown protein [Seminavis robusta]|eukprot:Sro314_g114990.1 n/a (294) ;mRNA; f:7410-8480